MRTGETEISSLLDQWNFAKTVSKTLVETLRQEDLLNYKGLRLLWFLHYLKAGTLSTLPLTERKEDIENFCELLKRKKGEKFTEVCFLFFEGNPRGERERFFFPRQMIKRLSEAGRLETDENLKEMIRYRLLTKENHLAELVSPNELVFALWSKNPIVRHNSITFLLGHYQFEDILKSILGHGEKKGERLPGVTFRRLIEQAFQRTKARRKRHLLGEILSTSCLSDEELNRIWSYHIRSLNRFELIELFSSEHCELTWMADLKDESTQLYLDFKSRIDNGSTHRFQGRIHRIRNGFNCR